MDNTIIERPSSPPNSRKYETYALMKLCRSMNSMSHPDGGELTLREQSDCVEELLARIPEDWGTRDDHAIDNNPPEPPPELLARRDGDDDANNEEQSPSDANITGIQKMMDIDNFRVDEQIKLPSGARFTFHYPPYGDDMFTYSSPDIRPVLTGRHETKNGPNMGIPERRRRMRTLLEVEFKGEAEKKLPILNQNEVARVEEYNWKVTEWKARRWILAWCKKGPMDEGFPVDLNTPWPHEWTWDEDKVRRHYIQPRVYMPKFAEDMEIVLCEMRKKENSD